MEMGLGLGLLLPCLRGQSAPAYYNPFTTNPASGSYVRVDQASARWQDTAGTIPAVAEDDPVMRLDDLSGNGANWIWSNAGNPPLLRLGGDAPAIETSYPGQFNVSDAGFSGSEITVGLSLNRTELSADQGARNSNIFKTMNDNIDCTNDNLGSSGAGRFRANIKRDGAQLQVQVNDWDTHFPVDQNTVFLFQADSGEAVLRLNQSSAGSDTDTPADLLSFGTAYYLLATTPTLLYGGIVKTGTVDEAERALIEEALVQMHGGS